MTRMSTCFVVLCTILSLSPALNAQEVAVATKALIRAGAALGVLPGSVVSVNASGTYTLIGARDSYQVHPFRLKAVGVDKARWEIDFPEGTVTTVVSEGRGWRESSRRTRRPVPLSQVAGRTSELLPILALSNWATLPHVRARYLGVQEVEGKEFVHIAIRRSYPSNAPEEFRQAYESVTRCELFLDPVTYRPERLRYYSHPVDWRRDIPVDLVFSDFQLINGVLFPMKIERHVGKRKMSEIRFLSVSLNSPISDDEFER